MEVSQDLKISCKLKDIKKTITRKDFLRQFLSEMPATYNQDGTEQARPYSARSFTDLLYLTKSRFSRSSLNSIVRIVAQLNIEGVCDVVYCGQIKKFVVRGGKRSPGIPFVTNYSVKYHGDRIGEDGISYTQLMKIREEQNIK
jgi:hypothetical protein|tara:strand:+ start:144 stop:572 length:429 start_codon:yes stop_codon:yes gene_type:complete